MAAGRATNDPANYFALGVQGAKDQDAGTFYYFKHLNGTGFDVDFDVDSAREGGAGREESLRYKTMIKSDGSVVAYARPDGAARLFAWALGADLSPSIIASTGWLVNHLITPIASGGLPYLTADQAWADEVERTTNCIITQLDVEGEAGKPIKITGNFVSGGTPHVATAALSPTRESGDPFFYPGASVSISAGGGAGTVATSIEMTKYKLSIKNTVDDGIQTTGLNREDVIWEVLDFDVDGTLKYENKAFWEAVNYGGGTQVPVGLATGAFNFFTPLAGASYSMRVCAPLVQIADLKVNRLDPDGKTMYLDFTASTIKNATTSLFANFVTGATGSYTATAT